MMGLFAAVLLAQEGRSPEFTKFDFARERIGHKVIVEAELSNPASVDLTDVKITAIYYDGDLELRRSKPVSIPKIIAGSGANVRIEAEQVPNFTYYEVFVQVGSNVRVYHGSDPIKLPALKKSAPPRLAVVSQKDVPPAGSVGDARLTLVVKNSGGTEAVEPTAVLTVQPKSGAEQMIYVRLEKAIAPGTEDTFDVLVYNVPAYYTLKTSVVWLAAEGLTMGDPPAGVREVVIRQCRIARLAGGLARVNGVLQNGLAVPAAKVEATFRLGNREAAYALPGILKAGESRPFEFYIPHAPPADNAAYNVSFADAANAKDEPAARAPASRRIDSKKIEGGTALKLPPPPEKNDDASAALIDNAVKVEIRGLLVVEGYYSKNNKYTGDVYLMRLMFMEKGKPAQPTGTLEATIYDGPKALKKIQRIITKESWKVEAARVNNQTAQFDTIAFDRKTGELWVGLHWSEGPFADPRADITLTIPEQGSYTWKDMQKRWASAPRLPDKK